MGKGLPRSMSRTGGKAVAIARINIPITGVTVPNIDGASGIGWGTVVIGDLPEGNILVHGAVLQGTMTEAHAGVIATFVPTVSVGSTATADTTLDGTDVDVIPSTAQAAAVSSVATIRATSSAASAGVILDNTDGSLELNLNVLIPDASISADDVTLAFAGTLMLIYSVLGDD